MAYTTIDNPGIYFNTVIYTGNGTAIGSGGQAITGVGFQPDWVSIKDRTDSDRPRMFDSVRGVTKELDSSDVTGETTLTEGLTAFGSDGFTVGNHAGVNSGSDNFVAWNWKAGTSFSNDASATSVGTIDSSGSINTTAGFSIISYTGNGNDDDTAKIAHGLGVAANMITIKCRNNDGGWQTSSTALGFNNVLQLNRTNAQASGTYAFGQSGVAPTSTVFTVSATSGDNHTNTNNNTYIAFCFAEKKGYSKFGSYAPNGSADGNFIYLGFSPAFFLVKNTNTTRNWLIFDNKRNTSNEITKSLEPNTSDAEQTDSNLKVDFLSNGVKLRGLGGDLNTSDGVKYIYMSFAESPFVNSNGVPTNAR